MTERTVAQILLDAKNYWMDRALAAETVLREIAGLAESRQWHGWEQIHALALSDRTSAYENDGCPMWERGKDCVNHGPFPENDKKAYSAKQHWQKAHDMYMHDAGPCTCAEEK